MDATELDEGCQKKNDYYLSRCYNKGGDNEFYKYHRSVLEAKIYFGNNLVCSIASETIENSEEYINKSDETVKQDCESKAFVRLAAKIKKKFPRLPIIIAADGLYVSQNVLQICKEYHWDYIIRYICITKNNAKKIVDAGRNRWKIENQGFNRQKHWQGNIEHACSLFHEGISALYHCG